MGRQLIRAVVFVSVVIAVLVSAGSEVAWAGDGLPLLQDSLLAVSAFDEVDFVLEYSPPGQLLGMLELVDPEGHIGIPSGVTMAGGQLWVAGSDSIARVDSVSGLVTEGFAVTDSPNLVGLADAGGLLLVAEVHPDRVHRYRFDGGLVETIELVGEDPLLITGVDTDGLNLYVATHVTGDVHVFGFDGVESGRIEIDFVADLTGVAVDSEANELWVATGTGANEIHRFDLAGTPLGSFEAAADGVMGLHAMGSLLFGDGFEAGDLGAWE